MNENNHIDQAHVDQDTQDLLNGSIDGELSAVEQDELDRLLASSETVREFNEELKSVTRLLDELPEIEPPHYLQESIERQVRLPVQNTGHEEKQGFLRNWLPTHWLRTGFALAAGAVLTVSVYEMGSGPITAEDANKLVGTVVKSPANGQGELLDSVDIVTETLNGLVELRYSDDLYTLDVQLNSDGPTQVVVDFAGRGLKFEGVTRTQDRNDAVSITEGTINVTSSGEQLYVLNLRRAGDAQGQQIRPLKLEFFAGNMLVHEAELRVSRQ